MSSDKMRASTPLPDRAIRAAAGKDAVRLAHQVTGAIRRAESILASAHEAAELGDRAAKREARRRALAEADVLQRLAEQLAEASREVADALALSSRAMAASQAYRGCEHSGTAR